MSSCPRGPEELDPRLVALHYQLFGFAHDLNNILTAVLGHGEMALGDSSLSKRTRAQIRGVVQAAELGKGLTKGLVDLARLPVLFPVNLELNDFIRALIPTLVTALGPRIVLRANLMAGIANVKIRADQLTRALYNLALNTRDAMPSGGNLTISTFRVKESVATRVAGLIMGSPRQSIVLRFSDDGCGMDAFTKEHAFDPFFSTKHRDDTSVEGMGLCIVKQIVQECGGRTYFFSRLGKGTSFYLVFPEAV